VSVAREHVKARLATALAAVSWMGPLRRRTGLCRTVQVTASVSAPGRRGPLRLHSLEILNAALAQVTLRVQNDEPSDVQWLWAVYAPLVQSSRRRAGSTSASGSYARLLQRAWAEVLCARSIYNWQNGRSKPGVSYMPAIIRFWVWSAAFVGHMADRSVQGRSVLGLTQSAAAGRIGVDACTLARW
jgi:hypothetical protein